MKINFRNNLILGLIFSIIYFTSDTIFTFFVKNVTVSMFYISLLLFYLIIGLFLSLSVFIIHYILKLFTENKNLDLINMLLFPVLIIFFQGGIILNVSIIHGANFSLHTIFIDFIWLLLCSAMFLTFFAIFRKKELFKSEISIYTGLFIAILLISVCNLLFISNESGFFNIIFQLLKIIVAASIGLFLGILISTILFKVFKSSDRKQLLIKTTLSLFALVFVVLIILSPHIIKEKMEVLKPNVKSNSNLNYPNIILIVIDTMRSDHLSCYGYERNTTPNIDKFSKDAILFKDCYSQANHSNPGHASLFTGKYPISHGAHDPSYYMLKQIKNIMSFPLMDEEVTLAEVLKENGYLTAAANANSVWITKKQGFHQGFDFWYNKYRFIYEPKIATIFRKLNYFEFISRFTKIYLNAAEINEVVFNWLDKYGKNSFFLFINYMDPHWPYIPEIPYNKSFPAKTKKIYISNPYKFLRQEQELSEEEKNYLISNYDGETKYTDYHIGILLDKLKSMGIYKNSIIIITSDHGEFLGEHNRIIHGTDLYDPVVKVPLIIKPHKSYKGQLFNKNTVQLIDVFPTILNMIAVPIPDDVQGTSLTKDTEHDIISENYNDWGKRDIISLVKDNYKFILSTDGSHELYNLEKDPGEINNLIDKESEIYESLKNELLLWKKSIKEKIIDKKYLPKMDSETIRKLRALGYIK